VNKEEYKQWQTFMELKNAQAAQELGVTHWTIEKYRQGVLEVKGSVEKLALLLKQIRDK